MSTQITITGNIGQVDLKFIPSGKAVLEGSVAVNRRRFDRNANEWQDVGTDWHRFSIWGDRAESLAEHLTKGMRVVVLGELESRDFETNGQKRTAWDIKATEIGIVPKSNAAPRQQPTRQRQPVQQDPWATSSRGADDLPPF